MAASDPKLVPPDARWRRRTFGVLAALSLLLRLPYWFRTGINWDEGTFVLMGRSVLQGNLPYVEAWDMKPPLAYLPFALFQVVPLPDLLSVRLGGALAVFASAALLALSAREMVSDRAGLLSGVLCVFALSLLPSGQATMTEPLALVPLLGAFWFLQAQRRNVVWAGALLGAAAMIRLNLAYVAVAAGFVVLLFPRDQSWRGRGVRLTAYAAAGGVPVLATFLPYLWSERVGVWWASVVQAPLDYVASGHGPAVVLAEYGVQVAEGLSRWTGNGVGLGLALWGAAALGIPLAIARCMKAGTPSLESLCLLLAFLLGTGIGIATGGVARGHYLLQLVPFVALCAAVSLDVALEGPSRRIVLAGLAVAGLTAALPVALEYQHVRHRVQLGLPALHGGPAEVARYLSDERHGERDVWLLTDHIAYQLLDVPIRGRLAHPSDYSKASMVRHALGPEATAAEEVDQILRQNPTFIVFDQSGPPFGEESEAVDRLREELAKSYDLRANVRGRLVYRRVD